MFNIELEEIESKWNGRWSEACDRIYCASWHCITYSTTLFDVDVCGIFLWMTNESVKHPQHLKMKIKVTQHVDILDSACEIFIILSFNFREKKEKKFFQKQNPQHEILSLKRKTRFVSQKTEKWRRRKNKSIKYFDWCRIKDKMKNQ